MPALLQRPWEKSTRKGANCNIEKTLMFVALHRCRGFPGKTPWSSATVCRWGLPDVLPYRLLPQRHSLPPRIRAAGPAVPGAQDSVQSARFVADSHVVSHALELGREALESGSLLEVGRSVAVAHVRCGDGPLYVH